MTNQPVTSRHSENSIAAIATSLVIAVALGFLLSAVHAPDAVQSSALAIAVGLPAAIAYQRQARRRDTTEDAARIGKGELRRPIGLVVAMFGVALFLAYQLLATIVGLIAMQFRLENLSQTIDNRPLLFLVFGVDLLLVGAAFFAISSYASHYLGKDPYLWTLAAGGWGYALSAATNLVGTVLAGEFDSFAKLFGAFTGAYIVWAPCLGASLAGTWHGRRHHDKFLAAKLVRMERKAAQQAMPSPQTPQSSQAPDLIEQLKKLADLRVAGVLTEDEFQAKKVELLERI